MDDKGYVIDQSTQSIRKVTHIVKRPVRVYPSDDVLRYETMCGREPLKPEFHSEQPEYPYLCQRCRSSQEALLWKERQATKRPRRRKSGEFLKGDTVRFKWTMWKDGTICGVPVTEGTVIKAVLSSDWNGKCADSGGWVATEPLPTVNGLTSEELKELCSVIWDSHGREIWHS